MGPNKALAAAVRSMRAPAWRCSANFVSAAARMSARAASASWRRGLAVMPGPAGGGTGVHMDAVRADHGSREAEDAGDAALEQ